MKEEVRHEQKKHLFRQVFDNEMGKEVLQEILKDLCFFQTVHTPEQMALHNAAKHLLWHCGYWEKEKTITARLMQPWREEK